MAVTARQAAAALRQYQAAVPVAVVRGLRRGLRRAEGLAKTKYMERMDNRRDKAGRFIKGGGSGYLQPPNPPPGPLAIRQGNLARTVKITDITVAGNTVTGGLAAGNSDVRYGRIHELGGMAGRARIQARPYLRPALEDPETKLAEEVRRELQKLARSVLRGVMRPA
jgi:hypothetical protein